jgi:site-specific DNA recombinase
MGGAVPFGYDVDEDGRLTPSEHVIPELGIAEAELVRDLFARIEAGSGTVAEARRLTLLGVKPVTRYKDHVTQRSAKWSPERIRFILRNHAYAGVAILNTRRGEIRQETVPLVSESIWQRVQVRLHQNQVLSRKNARHDYLLRGLIRCECGYGYVGSPMRRPGGKVTYWYRCNRSGGDRHYDASKRCRSKALRAADLERHIWAMCREFILNPGPALDEARERQRAMLERSASNEVERQTLYTRLGEIETERERVMTLFRRNRMTLDEVERALDEIDRDRMGIRSMLDDIRSRDEIAQVFEARLASSVSMAARLRAALELIEATDDFERKRAVVEQLITRIGVRTIPIEGRNARHWRAEVTVARVFGEVVPGMSIGIRT